MSAPKPEPPAKNGAENAKEAAAAAPAAGKSGMGAWLPLVITLVAMPLLAYATTTFLILPKLKQGAESTAEEPAAQAEGAKADHGAAKEKGGHSSASTEKSGGGHAAPKKKAGEKGKTQRTSVAFSKMVVNIAGTMGTRYLVVSFSLVSTHPDFKTEVEENKEQLTDLAISTLGSKTIVDMERPEAKNQLRSELVSAFNGALGGESVQELFFTEFAMQ